MAADSARVWELVTDISVPARFSPELYRTRWLSGHRSPAVGARFEGWNSHPAIGEWRTVAHVLWFDAPRLFGWVVLDEDNRFGGGPVDPERPGATWQFRVTEVDGGCRLSQSVRIGPGRSGLSLVIERAPDQEEQIVARRLAALRDGMTATLNGIKREAEQTR
ncbi:SRPBCC family protein [Actinoplanes sp. NPDC051861]|uniref:SRPBCC family protein n=1 Tax=Actinoplanes sp. NPDC051861 TaxID=3155170 RepID=UPI0034249167